MENRGKLNEVLQHVFEDEYNKLYSTDESSEEDYEPCERVAMLFVDEENIETVRYEAVVSNVVTCFSSYVMPCVYECI